MGYLLMAVPNVEAFTAILFVSGFTLGINKGIQAALIAAIIYFGFNPQGGVFPPLLIAQCIGVAAAPIAGSFARKKNLDGVKLRLLLAVSALIVTLWYDLLTTLAFPLSAGFDARGIIATMVAGVLFSLIHVVGNMIIFVVVVPPLLNLVSKSVKRVT